MIPEGKRVILLVSSPAEVKSLAGAAGLEEGDYGVQSIDSRPDEGVRSGDSSIIIIYDAGVVYLVQACIPPTIKIMGPKDYRDFCQIINE